MKIAAITSFVLLQVALGVLAYLGILSIPIALIPLMVIGGIAVIAFIMVIVSSVIIDFISDDFGFELKDEHDEDKN